MKTLRHIVLFVLCLPFNLIVGWPVVLFIRAAWGTNLCWENAPKSGGLPALTCELKPDSWPARSWYKGWSATTFGHAIFYASDERVYAVDGKWGTVQEHEHVHVKQFESAMVGHALLGLLVGAPLEFVSFEAGIAVALSIWFLGFLVFLVGGWLGALLRGEPVYRGSAHEEAARSRVEAPDA
jgi:hypothetical protein